MTHRTIVKFNMKCFIKPGFYWCKLFVLFGCIVSVCMFFFWYFFIFLLIFHLIFVQVCTKGACKISLRYAKYIVTIFAFQWMLWCFVWLCQILSSELEIMLFTIVWRCKSFHITKNQKLKIVDYCEKKYHFFNQVTN